MTGRTRGTEEEGRCGAEEKPWGSGGGWVGRKKRHRVTIRALGKHPLCDCVLGRTLHRVPQRNGGTLKRAEYNRHMGQWGQGEGLLEQRAAELSLVGEQRLETWAG